MLEITQYEKFLFNSMMAIEAALADENHTTRPTPLMNGERAHMKTSYATAILALTDEQIITYAEYRKSNRNR